MANCECHNQRVYEMEVIKAMFESTNQLFFSSWDLLRQTDLMSWKMAGQSPSWRPWLNKRRIETHFDKGHDNHCHCRMNNSTSNVKKKRTTHKIMNTYIYIYICIKSWKLLAICKENPKRWRIQPITIWIRIYVSICLGVAISISIYVCIYIYRHTCVCV